MKTLQDIELLLPAKAVKEICTTGANDEAVLKWALKLGHKIDASKQDLMEMLLEQGGYEEIIDRGYIDILGFAIWCAAWNKFEN
jgi:hypothetical protein